MLFPVNFSLKVNFKVSQYSFFVSNRVFFQYLFDKLGGSRFVRSSNVSCRPQPRPPLKSFGDWSHGSRTDGHASHLLPRWVREAPLAPFQRQFGRESKPLPKRISERFLLIPTCTFHLKKRAKLSERYSFSISIKHSSTLFRSISSFSVSTIARFRLSHSEKMTRGGQCSWSPDIFDFSLKIKLLKNSLALQNSFFRFRIYFLVTKIVLRTQQK